MRRNWSRTGGNFFFQDLSNRGEKLNRGTNSSIDRGTCNDGEARCSLFSIRVLVDRWKRTNARGILRWRLFLSMGPDGLTNALYPGFEASALMSLALGCDGNCKSWSWDVGDGLFDGWICKLKIRGRTESRDPRREIARSLIVWEH